MVLLLFNFWHLSGKQVVLSTSGNPNLKDNITDVFGAKQVLYN